MLSSLVLLPFVASIASAINLTVASSGGNVTSPLLYGLMFEDINHSGDGGIYAELIQNRAFQGSTEHPSTLEPWAAIGNATLSLQNTSVPLSSALPVSINVAAASEKTKGTIGLSNPGWWGIDIQPQPYTGSFFALGSYKGKFTIKLKSALTSQVFASLSIPSSTQADKWVEHKFVLEPKIAAPNVNNTFTIEFESGQGSVNFNLISLFPPTYKGTPNGNRPELMAALKGLNPSFLRMPGGNNIEGDSYHYRWAWNETIGPLTSRPGRPGTWGYENTDGLGLIEYFNWCTDLEMEPLLAVWSGMYLGTKDVLSEAALAPYVNDTLNELEFLLGDASTPYGSLRASLGYPKPFELKYVEIGNEDNLEGGAGSYASYRFSMFFNAIHAKYPDITIISSTGDLTAVGDGSATDYHVYTLPDHFVANFDLWDNVPRTHKVLLGEYANVQYNIKDQPLAGVNWSAAKLEWPIWAGAISESIWSIGAERNGDVIIGQSYAPGFMNRNSYEWSPDLISFTADPAQTVLSTSYYAIELLSNARYNATVPITSDTGFGPAYWVAGVSEPGKYTFKTAIYNATSTVPFNIAFEGLSAGSKGTLTVLTAPDGLSSNTLVDGTVVDVVQKKVTELKASSAGSFTFELENYSVAVLTT
ncbi:probable alpha-N-arabinofuranosidase A precursor [Phialocephala subalpina]|uniref:non-reducing end alpha-L-arabinofuranosidase n=1 Tax=Phialocephala subalpina TaxID=576137 RepID=A0A1L7XF15_9HELO|nr:probable alpha-N-arabinofuranosidase A precursor [Phialocephala subalpina]